MADLTDKNSAQTAKLVGSNSDGTEREFVGSVEDRLKVTQAIGQNLAYDDMNASNGGVARETEIGGTLTTIYSYTGAGNLFLFLCTLEKADAEIWEVQLELDSNVVFNLDTEVLKDDKLYNLSTDTNGAVVGVSLAKETFRFKVPNNQIIPFTTSMVVKARYTEGGTKKFRAGLAVLTKG